MEGTYNNPYAHTQTPLSPDTPTSATYQVNVNRQKTRKWVEAKVQNYDGDDWGTDEYDDDEPEAPPPVPRVTTGLRPVGQRLPSETKPSARLTAAAAAAASSSRSVSGPPALRLQTQQPSATPTATATPAPAPTSQTPASTGTSAQRGPPALPVTEAKTSTPTASTQSQDPGRTATPPGAARNTSPAPASASVPTRFPPRKSSIGQQNAPESFHTGQLASAASSVKSGHSVVGPRTASPAGRATSDRSSPLVRPSEIYRRVGDEKEQERNSTSSPRPSVESVSAKPSDSASLAGDSSHQDEPDKDDSPEKARRTQSTLDSIAERKNPPEVKEDDVAGIEQIDRNRLSVSPQLPDVARMSVFGADFFSTATKDFSDAPPVPQVVQKENTQQEPPVIPGPSVSVSETTAGAIPTPPAPTVDRSSTSTPQSLPATNSGVPTVPTIMEDSEANGAESNAVTQSQESQSEPPNDVPESITSKPLSVVSETHSQPGVSPISESEDQKPTSSARANPDLDHETGRLSTTTDPRSLPPLHTPHQDPRGTIEATSAHDEKSRGSPKVATTSSSTSSQVPVPDITPTEPLQPRRPHQPLEEFEPRAMQREPTLSTVTSSPVKESDVLSDEIIKSLSPVGNKPSVALPPGDENRSLAPGPRGDLRTSTYTLSDYDNYWADTTEKPAPGENKKIDDVPPAVEPTKESVPEPSPSVEIPITSTEVVDRPQPQNEPKAESPEDSRRRFSWEMEFEDNVKVLKLDSPAAESSRPNVPSINPPSPLGPADVQSPKDFVSEVTSPGGDSSRTMEPPSIGIPPPGGISHQVSKASTAHPAQQQASVLEPPSPISVTSEKHGSHPPENRPVSLLAEDRHSASTPTPPPPEYRPTLAPVTSQPPPSGQQSGVAAAQPVMSMRDIMNLPNSGQRQAKYEETRQTFSSMESGLQNWILSMKSQHPEHANVTAVFGGGLPASRLGLHTPSSSGSYPAPQQPYYQQYLNASSPATSVPSSGRSRMGGLPLTSQGTSSGFGNSSNQIGTKSKEFMHTAGKMGKGLLSKGKSKLRGTGDKGEPIPPPTAHPKTKNERRTSWSLSLGARSRTDGPAVHSNKEMIVNNAPDQPSQLLQPAHMSLSESTSQTSQTPYQQDPSQAHVRRYSDDSGQLTSVDKSHNESLKWEIPTPVNDGAPWDPFRDSKIANEDDSDVDDHNGVRLGMQKQQRTDVPTDTTSPRSSEEWVVVPQSNSQIRMVTPEPPSGQSRERALTQTQGDVTPRAIEADWTTQTQHEAPTPKRNSSFIGLPPIRRGSTFGLTNKAARPATERFPIDDDDEDGQSSRVSEVSSSEKGVVLTTTEPAPVTDTSLDRMPAPQSMLLHQQSTQVPVVHQQAQQTSSQITSQLPPQIPQSGSGPPQPPPQSLPPQSTPHQAQQQKAYSPLPLIAPNMIGSQIRLPPSGPWNLQESHLSEPLHVVSRNRAGTGSSQQQPYFGYDKETGMPAPTTSTTPAVPPASLAPTAPRAPEAPTAPAASPFTPALGPASPMKQQRKTSDVPPSSTRRYPELFSRPFQPANQQGAPVNPAASPVQQFPGQFSRESSFSKSGMGEQDVPVDNEERGRSRKASGLLKEIGSRFRRASTERRSSFVEVRLQPSGVRADDASEASVRTEDRKKRRASFLPGRQNRSSLDQGSRQNSSYNISTTLVNTDHQAQGSPAQVQGERRPSPFRGFGVVSSGGAKSKTEHPPGSSRSSMVNEPVATGNSKGPLKKRFSGFATKSGVAGVFHRSSQEQVQKPGSSHSVQTATDPRRFGPQNPPLTTPQGIVRSSTTGPIPYGSPHAGSPGTPEPEGAEYRKRRGSAADLISGLLGHHNSPKLQDQPENGRIGTPPEGRQPLLRRMTGSSSLLDPQTQTPQDRPSSSNPPSPQLVRAATDLTISPVSPVKQPSQPTQQQPRPSPLRQDVPLTQSEPVRRPVDTSSPKPSTAARPSSPAEGSPRMMSGPPRDSKVLHSQSSQTLDHAPSPAQDSNIKSGADDREAQTPANLPPKFPRRSDAPGGSSQNPSPNPSLPQSPISQMSKAEPPSVASSIKTHSPRLGSSVAALGDAAGRNQSQPGTPTLSQASRMPPAQQQSFGSRMSIIQSHTSPHISPHTQQREQSSPQGYQIPPGTQQTTGFPVQHPSGPPFPGLVQGPPAGLRPSLQMSNSMPSQFPQKNNLAPPGQGFIPMAGPPRQDSPSSKWKGLKNRMSGQASHTVPQPQDKLASTEKASATKFLSAFKRSSKQPGAPQGQMFTQVPPGGHQFQQGSPLVQQQQRQQQQQPQHFQQPQQQLQQQQPQQLPPQQRPQQFMQQAPNSQVQQQRQSVLVRGPPMDQVPFQQTGRSASFTTGVPAPAPGQLIADPRQGVQDPLQRQRPLARPYQEPQYAQVPIPRGYEAVRGASMPAMTPYNVGRPLHPGYRPQQTHTGQQMQPQQPQPSNSAMLRQASSPQIMQQQQTSLIGERRASDMPGTRTGPSGQGGYVSPPLRGSSFEAQQGPRSDVARMASRESNDNSRTRQGSGTGPLAPPSSATNSMPSPVLQERQSKPQSNTNGVLPKAPMEDAIGRAPANIAATPSPKHQTFKERDVGTRPMVDSQPASPGLVVGSSVTTSPSPMQRSTITMSPSDSNAQVHLPPADKPAEALSTKMDDDKPQIEGESSRTSKSEVINHKSGSSQAGSERPVTPEREKAEGVPVRSPAQEENAHAELEDTNEAHQRKLRLESQEEKIHFDPDADSDGELPPQMSATSYPGQEWNPYGMPEYGEWNEQ